MTELSRLNELQNPSLIYVGQQLLLREATNATESTTSTVTSAPTITETTTYTVQAGDTLYAIGRLFNVSPADLQQANTLINPNQLYIGQSLIIPTDTTSTTPPVTLTESYQTNIGSGKQIIVDISEQTIYLYNSNNALLHRFVVATGNS